MYWGESLRFTWEALRVNKIRAFLTSLGMVIGTASVILVVTIGLTGKRYIMEQIQGVGSNLIYATYEASANPAATPTWADEMNMGDVQAIEHQVRNLVASSAVIIHYDRLVIDHQERDVTIIGATPGFRVVRNLKILEGRFLDDTDLSARNKVAMLTEELARKMFPYGNAIGNFVKIHRVNFTVIAVFKEGVETFGQSEITKQTVVIPITVSRYFTKSDKVDMLYVSVERPEDVPYATRQVAEILKSRHRAGSSYRVENLAAILETANRIGNILTVVLLLISFIALLISGIGIMNIMLVTVTERTREIGIKKAVGARRREIMMQFLTEALTISTAGGAAGILLGVSIPLIVRSFVSELQISVSPASIVIAFAVSTLVGVIFGLVPADKASKLHPTESLRYE
ncbi:MAG TPA: ABC transporter permease [Candidatus Acidoferrales bacterium]